MKKTISKLCEEAGIHRATYYARIKRGITHEEALAPKREKTIDELCEEAGIQRGTCNAHIKKG